MRVIIQEHTPSTKGGDPSREGTFLHRSVPPPIMVLQKFLSESCWESSTLLRQGFDGPPPSVRDRQEGTFLHRSLTLLGITDKYCVLISRIWKSTSNRFQAEEDQDETLFDSRHMCRDEFGFIPDSVKKATDFSNSRWFFWYPDLSGKSTVIVNSDNKTSSPSRAGQVNRKGLLLFFFPDLPTLKLR